MARSPRMVAAAIAPPARHTKSPAWALTTSSEGVVSAKGDSCLHGCPPEAGPRHATLLRVRSVSWDSANHTPSAMVKILVTILATLNHSRHRQMSLGASRSGPHDEDVEGNHHGRQSAGRPRRGGQHGRAPPQLAAGHIHLSGRAGGVHELAPRAEVLARDRRALRPVPSHGQLLHVGPRRAEAALRHRHQQLRELPREHGQAVRPDRLQRRRHRRRHPVPRGGGRLRLRRPRARRELAAVPRRDRRLRHRDTLRRPFAVAALRRRGEPRVLPLPDPGSERVADHRKAQRRAAREGPVLPHGRDDDRRRACADASPRHGRCAGARAVRTVRAARQDPRRDPRGRPRVRHRALRLARVLVEHARVRLDPVAPARDLLERGRARLPRVAARRPATRPSTRSPDRSSRTTSRTTTSTRGSWDTARS